MKSKIYIPTYKRRPNTIIEYIKQFPNVKFVVDNEDYEENYNDIPKEQCLIVPVECRGLLEKRQEIVKDAQKTNSLFFMFDDDISNRVRYNDGIKCRSVDLYEALEHHERIHIENDLVASSGSVINITTGHWNPTMKVGVARELCGIFLIDSTKIEYDWFSLDKSITEDIYFTYQLKKRNLKFLNLFQLSYSFKCIGSKSLIQNNTTINSIKAVNTFLRCNRLFDLRYLPNDKQFPMKLDNRYSLQYDKIKELYGEDKNISAVINYLNKNNESCLDDFFEI